MQKYIILLHTQRKHLKIKLFGNVLHSHTLEIEDMNINSKQDFGKSFLWNNLLFLKEWELSNIERYCVPGLEDLMSSRFHFSYIGMYVQWDPSPKFLWFLFFGFDIEIRKTLLQTIKMIFQNNFEKGEKFGGFVQPGSKAFYVTEVIKLWH